MEEAKKEIIEATNSALQKHSYSDLSIQNIADEFEKSKSLLYHHYNSKDEILLDFLDHILERFEDEVFSEEGEDIVEEFQEKAFMAFNVCEDCGFLKTLVELRAQALRDEEFSKRFERFEEVYVKRITELLEEGQREGEFRKDLKAEKVARFINLVNNEAIYRKAENHGLESSKDELRNYLDSRVYS